MGTTHGTATGTTAPVDTTGISATASTTLVPSPTSSDDLGIETLTPDGDSTSSDLSTSGGAASLDATSEGSTSRAETWEGTSQESSGSTSAITGIDDDSSTGPSSAGGSESTGTEPPIDYCASSRTWVFCEDFDSDGWTENWTMTGEDAAFSRTDGVSPPSALAIDNADLATDVSSLAITRVVDTDLSEAFRFRSSVRISDACSTEASVQRTLMTVLAAPNVGPSRTGTRGLLRLRGRALEFVFIPDIASGIETVTDLEVDLTSRSWQSLEVRLFDGIAEILVDDVVTPNGPIDLGISDLGLSRTFTFAVGQIEFVEGRGTSCAVAFDDVAVMQR